MPKLTRQTRNEVYAERDKLKSINADLLAALGTLIILIENPNTDANHADLEQAQTAYFKAHQ